MNGTADIIAEDIATNSNRTVRACCSLHYLNGRRLYAYLERTSPGGSDAEAVLAVPRANCCHKLLRFYWPVARAFQIYPRLGA